MIFVMYDLVMPFVTVATQGGPHDDESYVCGFEMGALDVLLDSRVSAVEQVIHASNLPQVDLIAMKHGYTMTLLDEEDEGWAWIRLTY